MIEPPPTGSLQDNPAVPRGTTPLRFRTFTGGMNTESSRSAIQDGQQAWTDGWMPVGDNNLRTLWGLGGALYTATPHTVVWFDSVVLAGTAWIIALVSDGSLVAIDYANGNVTIIAAAATITTPARGQIGMCAWGSQFAIIVAAQSNGYFVWDGNTFYSPGGTISDAPGTDLPAAQFVASIAQADGVGSITGTTMTVTQWNFGAFGAGQTLIGTGVTSGTTISSQATGTSGQIGTYTVNNSQTIAATEISVAGTFMNVTNLISGVIAVGNLLSDPPTASNTTVTGQTSGASGGAGLYTVSVPQFVASGTITVGNFYSDLVPTGIGGSAAETYAGRVWIANGATITYSSPGSLTDYNPQNGSGSFTSSDSFLRTQYTALRQTNGFLYLIGDSSVNYISGVQTSGSPLVTTFTNQNADPEIGTPFGDAVDVFSRNIAFANTWGVHISYGGSVAKVSDALDGIYTTAPSAMLATPPSSAKAILFGKKCWMVLTPIVDPLTGLTENKLLIWDSKKWFASQQEVELVYIRGLELASDLVAFGTDGTSIYQLFANPSSGFTKTTQSKLWYDESGGLLTDKTTSRLWACVNLNIADVITVTFSIDTDVVSWPNTASTSAAVTVSISGQPGPVIAAPEAISNNGVLAGITVTTTARDLSLVEAACDSDFFLYRG